MSHVNIGLIFHFHQPVDNFGWVIQEAFELSYDPLLRSIENSPHLKVHLHFTGPLLEWLLINQPNFMDRVVKLVRDDKVSIVGGGFSEPILSMIPEEFRLKQIHKLRDWWKEKYDIDVFGCWLAERVWEPSLAKSLSDAGVDFIFIDDLFIKATGKTEEETFYSYFTEDQGRGVHVIPVNEAIRYLIPWKPVEKTIKYLKKGIDEKGETLIMIMSDAEKMGLWPAGARTTNDICYGNGWDGTPWMDKFFSKLTSKASIKTIHVQDYLRKNNSRGLIYIPSASYDKMGIWVLPTDDRRRIESLLDYAKNGKASYSREINRFTKGSFWRNFLSKYPEVNIMHKRTLLSYSAFTRSKQYVSEEDLINASNEIISAQSNDPYWHGMFGGAYYRFMRHSVFKHAIKGEQLALRKAGIDDSGIEAKDILMNGRNELIVSNNYFKAFFSAFEGGTMFEIDDLLSYYNWSNVFTRKEEAYHKDNFPVDRWIRRSFRDHFLIDTGFKNISNDRFEELGSFVDGNYSYKINENTLTLSFEGTIKLENNKFNAMITKTISMDANKLIVEYDIIGDKLDKDIFFSPELNFTLNSHPYMTSCVLSNENELEDIKYIDHGFELRVDQIKFIDNHERTMLKLSLPGTEKTVSYPVITFSYTNEGNEEQFQASCVMPIYRYNGKLSFSITVELESF